MNIIFKSAIIAAVLCCLCCKISNAQSVEEKKKIINYKTWISSMDNSPRLKGYLNEVNDNMIAITNLYGNERREINIQDIKTLSFRKKGKLGKGFFFGAMTGMVLGGIAGLASGDDSGGFISFSAEEKAVGFGILLTIPGAIIGGLISKAKIKIPINGRHEIYAAQRAEILKYKLVK